MDECECRTLPPWKVATLICVALALSSVLAVLSGFKNWLNKHRTIEFWVVLGSAAGCIACGLTGVILYLTGRLSLDAFSVVLIGLIPGIEAMSRLRITALLALQWMRRKPALHNNLQHFSYLRHGKPAPFERNGANGTSAGDRTYLRLPACAKAKVKDNNSEPIWNGRIVEFNDKMIVLKGDNDLGDAVEWWTAANNAVDIVRSPTTARLSKSEQVLRALELVAEIAMIGDYVLFYHEESLQKFMRGSDGLWKASSATPKSIYMTLMRRLDMLGDWGEMSEEVVRRIRRVGFKSLPRGQKYGMLFFILLVESGLFNRAREKFHYHRTARNVIKVFRDTKADEVRCAITKFWLMQYCEPRDRLFKYDEVGDVQAVAPSR